MFDSDIYIVVGSVVLLAAILLVVFLSSFRKSGGGARSLQGDLASMMILFQTMRDMLDRQKELARQLNESVDRKVDMIRKVVKAAADAHDELCQAQRALAEHLRLTRSEIETIQRRALEARHDAANAGPPQPTQRPVPVIPIPEPVAQPLPAAPRTVAEDEADFIDHWVGLEVAQPAPAHEPEDDAFTVTESEEEAHAARDAFRMLLNMATASQTPVPSAPPAHAPVPASEPPPPAEPDHHGNGHEDRMVGNRTLIYEYSDAGMSVTDIARELGMGKGEVRLILSLRKEEERKV